MQQAQRVERAVLPRRQEGHPGEQMRVPQRQLTLGDALPDELLPDVIFQDQVGEQGVMRHLRGADDFPVGAERLPLVQVVGGQQGAVAQRDRRVVGQRQQEEQEDDQQVGRAAAHKTHLAGGRQAAQAPGLYPTGGVHERQAASDEQRAKKRGRWREAGSQKAEGQHRAHAQPNTPPLPTPPAALPSPGSPGRLPARGAG